MSLSFSDFCCGLVFAGICYSLFGSVTTWNVQFNRTTWSGLSSRATLGKIVFFNFKRVTSIHYSRVSDCYFTTCLTNQRNVLSHVLNQSWFWLTWLLALGTCHMSLTVLIKQGYWSLRPSSYAVLQMSRIECKWGRTKDFSHLHSIRLMWSTASELGLRNLRQCEKIWLFINLKLLKVN